MGEFIKIWFILFCVICAFQLADEISEISAQLESINSHLTTNDGLRDPIELNEHLERLYGDNNCKDTILFAIALILFIILFVRPVDADGLVLDPNLAACPICEPCEERYKVHPDAVASLPSDTYNPFYRPGTESGGWGPRSTPFIKSTHMSEPSSFWLLLTALFGTLTVVSVYRFLKNFHIM